MKQIKIILALLLLGCFTLPSFAQTDGNDDDYIPVLEEGKTWYYLIAAQIDFHYGDKEFDGKSEGCFALTIHGDYEYSGNRWKGVYLSYKERMSPFPIVFLREEDREVFLLCRDDILSPEEVNVMDKYFQDIPCCLQRVLATFYSKVKDDVFPNGLKVLSFKKKFQYLVLDESNSYLLEDVFTTYDKGDDVEKKERTAYCYLFYPDFSYKESIKPYDLTLGEYNLLIDKDEEYFKESKLFSIYQDKEPCDITGYLNGYSFYFGQAHKLILLEGIGFTHISFFSTILLFDVVEDMHLTPSSWLLFVTDSTGNIVWGSEKAKETYYELLSGTNTIGDDNIKFTIVGEEVLINTLESKGNFCLNTIDGTKIAEYPITGINEERISIANLNKGVYIATLEAGGRTITRKFVK